MLGDKNRIGLAGGFSYNKFRTGRELKGITLSPSGLVFFNVLLEYHLVM